MDQARTPRDVADRQPLSNDQQASTVRKAVGLQVFLVCVCVCVCVFVCARACVRMHAHAEMRACANTYTYTAYARIGQDRFSCAFAADGRAGIL